MEVLKNRGWRWLKIVRWGILALLSAFILGSVVSNLLLPGRSDVVDHLSELDKARLAEVERLRHAEGGLLWAGWQGAPIPIILYNEGYAFLVGVDNPAAGWRTVPQDTRRGGAWEIVPEDSYSGRPYYRQRLPDDGGTPQAFTVRVGDLWAASVTTKDWTAIKMGNEIGEHVPAFIRPIVPYRLAGKLFLGLAMDSDGYICAIGHESFHAFQGIVAPDRLTAAELALSRDGRRYPWNDPGFSENWHSELNALADALGAKDRARMIDLCRTFLAVRHSRRLAYGLDTMLTNLERMREWEEGLAKFTELALWKLGAMESRAMSVPALSKDSDFNRYMDFSARWRQEMTTLRMQASAGETRFYYSGMAQAFLLERLSPQWKSRALVEHISLEKLLEEAIALANQEF